MNNLVMDYIASRFIRQFPLYSFMWRHERDSRNDFDADMLVLEAFGVPAEQAREFIRSTRPIREEAAALLGEKIIVGTHTPEATDLYYRAVLDKAAVNRTGLIEGIRISGQKELPAISCISVSRCNPRVRGRMMLPSIGGGC